MSEKLDLGKKEWEQYNELIKYYADIEYEYEKLRLFILKLHLAEDSYNATEMSKDDILSVMSDLICGLYEQSKKTDKVIRNRLDFL